MHRLTLRYVCVTSHCISHTDYQSMQGPPSGAADRQAEAAPLLTPMVEVVVCMYTYICVHVRMYGLMVLTETVLGPLLVGSCLGLEYDAPR